MRFSKEKSIVSNLHVNLCGKQLQWVTKFNYLGIQINSTLNDHDDIFAKRGEYYSSLNGLMSNFKGLPSDSILNQLYNQYCMFVLWISVLEL